MEYIKKCAAHYYGLSVNDLRLLAREFARKVGVNYPDNWDDNETAGAKWYRGFMARHKILALRKPESTSLNRVNSFNKNNVDMFFNNLEAVLNESNYEPNTIWNMDESGFSTVPNKFGKVIAVRGVRKVGQISSQERGTLISMALTVNAAGNSIPPFFLFPTKNMQAKFIKHASKGSVGFANGSGYMKQAEFVLFMRHFIRYTHSSKETPNLLLLDNHTSHLSIEALDLAAENGITLLSFPPHCTHKLQPLDVAVFGPVKSYYESEVKSWHTNHTNEKLEIADIPEIACKALDLALTPTNIKSGFRASGICPYNPNIFTASDFIQASIDDSNEPGTSQAQQEENAQRTLLVPDVGAEAEISTSEASRSEPSRSEPSTSVSRASSMSILDDIGPLRPTTPKPPRSKRGRPPMKSSVLTSPDNRDELREKRAKRDAAEERKLNRQQKKTPTKKTPTKKTPAKKTPAKKSTPQARARYTRSKSPEDQDFCIICMQYLPPKLTKNNSINCNSCDRAVHLSCANVYAGGYTCENCEFE